MREKRGFGPIRIGQELQERGVDDEVVAKYLLVNEEKWFLLSENTRIKKFGKILPEDFESKAKQMRFLQYRGFTVEQINRSVG